MAEYGVGSTLLITNENLSTSLINKLLVMPY